MRVDEVNHDSRECDPSTMNLTHDDEPARKSR